jgi:hypothetical protein
MFGIRNPQRLLAPFQDWRGFVRELYAMLADRTPRPAEHDGPVTIRVPEGQVGLRIERAGRREAPAPPPPALVKTTLPEGTFAMRPGSFALPEGTFSTPEGTFALPEGTFNIPEGTLLAPPGTFATPEGLFAQPEGTYEIPAGAFAFPEASERRDVPAPPPGPTPAPADARPAPAGRRVQSASARTPAPAPAGSGPIFEVDGPASFRAAPVRFEHPPEVWNPKAKRYVPLKGTRADWPTLDVDNPGDGGAGVLAGKVVSKFTADMGGKYRNGDTYKVTLYPDGPQGDRGDDVEVVILQISKDDEIPQDTWLFPIARLGTDGTYYAQPPVWIK